MLITTTQITWVSLEPTPQTLLAIYLNNWIIFSHLITSVVSLEIFHDYSFSVPTWYIPQNFQTQYRAAFVTYTCFSRLHVTCCLWFLGFSEDCSIWNHLSLLSGCIKDIYHILHCSSLHTATANNKHDLRERKLCNLWKFVGLWRPKVILCDVTCNTMNLYFLTIAALYMRAMWKI